MMDLVGNWLTGVTAAAILCALANSLMPDGPVRRVGRLACGLAVLAAVLGPVLRLEPMEPEAWLDRSWRYSGRSWSRPGRRRRAPS